MPEVGEELVGAWLRIIAGCDFVQYNVHLRDKQGEIDVIGLNLASATAFVCESATHLGGLQYTSGSQPDNVRKVTQKFQADIDYARRYLPDFQHRFMFWSPVVVLPRAADTKHNQFQDLTVIRQNVANSHQAEVEMVVNEIYLERINQLRARAVDETTASEYPVFRLLQIIAHLESHVDKLQKRGIDTTTMISHSWENN
jgi:hypothetical protein